MTEIMGVCGAGLCALVAVSMIREMRKEYTAVVILGISAVFLAYILPRMLESVKFIKEAASYVNTEYTSCVLKGLGITYLTCSAGELCRSSGENALAGYIETAGRAEILIICIPLFKELLELSLF